MKAFPLEIVSAGSIFPDMPQALALVVTYGHHNGLVQALVNLHPQSQSLIYLVEDPGQNQLPLIMDAAEKKHLPLLVLYGTETPEIAAVLPPSNARIGLISQGTFQRETFTTDLLSCKGLSYFAWLGYQVYHTNPSVLQMVHEGAHETLRLGQFRQHPTWAEPLLREASHHFIDLAAVRAADAPDLPQPTPNGLYAEELCTLGRFVGMSASFTSAFLYGYNPSLPAEALSTQLVAQLVWHITEGLAVAVREDPTSDSAQFERKAVQLGEEGQELIFLHSRQSGRWWMEVPIVKEPNECHFISCSVDDYALACKGEVPIKWLFYYQKYNNFS